MSQPYDQDRKQRAAYMRSVVGANVKRARQDAGITQKQASELLVGGPTSESYFRGIETGAKQLSLVRLVEIADTLGVSAAQLLYGL